MHSSNKERRIRFVVCLRLCDPMKWTESGNQPVVPLPLVSAHCIGAVLEMRSFSWWLHLKDTHYFVEIITFLKKFCDKQSLIGNYGAWKPRQWISSACNNNKCMLARLKLVRTNSLTFAYSEAISSKQPIIKCTTSATIDFNYRVTIILGNNLSLT